MSSKLWYADAVKLLGGADKRIVSALNKLTGGLLLATTGGGGQFVLSLFDVEGELARLNRELVGRLGDQLRGLGRLDRTERLTAAHRVIVPWTPPSLDSFWTFKIPPDGEMRQSSGWRDIFVSAIRKESYFTCDTAEDIVWHAIEPIALEMDAQFDFLLGKEAVEATSAFGVLAPDRAISVTNAMVGLWVTSSDPDGGDKLERAYEDCLAVIERSRPRDDTVSRDDYIARVLRQLAADHRRLSPQFRARMRRRFKETILREDHLTYYPVLRHWEAEAFGDLDHSGD